MPSDGLRHAAHLARPEKRRDSSPAAPRVSVGMRVAPLVLWSLGVRVCLCVCLDCVFSGVYVRVFRVHSAEQALA